MKAFLATLLAALVLAGCVFLQEGRPVSRSSETRLFVIAKGQGIRDIADALASEKLIRSRAYFLYLAWSRGDHGAFKAGSFELSPSMPAGEIERTLAQGRPVSNEREVTILEGWTLDDIADYLEAQGVSSKKDFYAEVGESAKPVKPGDLPDWSASYPMLASKPATASLEGYLFPDTYRIYADGGIKALVRRMLDNFQGKYGSALGEESARVEKRSVHEIVTMASLIEREVRGEKDRTLVSDIFWKRVEAGMPLQADSTVNYVTGHSRPSASYLDTKVDSPWNTYRYKGLPPTPIGNPGLSAIKAALNPEPNPYWYFLTDKEGNVRYAKTFQEHVANKSKYLR